MNNHIEYKGFVGTIKFCDVDNIYHGKVIGLPNTYISYHGDSLESLYADFVDSIEFHLLPDVDETEPNVAPYAEPMTG